ncbi:MAG: hypothetical protein L3J67_10385 [Hyphomicrobiaceae bacterium]|nr:hypothetical protein [Hyphomicrobiaceae bacterium]
MKISQIREVLEKYSRITACSDRPEKVVALDEFSKILAPVDRKTVAFVMKKIAESKKVRG